MRTLWAPDVRASLAGISLVAVVAGELGPPPGRRGEGSGRLWWRCPFHGDANPSFAVRPRERTWHCFGCGAHGDAVDLVRRLHPRLGFTEAVAYLTGGVTPSTPAAPRRPAPAPPPAPSGLPEGDALALARDAEARLWGPDGGPALDYLRGRGLADATIRNARLGWTPGVSVPRSGGRAFRVSGIVLPWFDGGRLALVKVRQPEGREPRYAEAFRDPARVVCYPGPDAARAGLPLVVTEGEFDALLLGQELAGLASVVTLGSASSKPAGKALSVFLRCPHWHAAHDNDPAGELAASAWPSRARRTRPPGAFKDWTEVVQAPRMVNLRRWWSDVFAGHPRPPLYTWDELSTWRWADADGRPDSPENAP